MCCTRLAEITYKRQKRQKFAIWAPLHNFVGLYLRNCIDLYPIKRLESIKVLGVIINDQLTKWPRHCNLCSNFIYNTNKAHGLFVMLSIPCSRVQFEPDYSTVPSLVMCVLLPTGRNKTPFLCPWGRVALSFGRVAQRDKTTASCGPFTSWTERSHDCELSFSPQLKTP